MRGELLGVWSETWREIWQPLIEDEEVPNDIFCELYRELAKAFESPPSVEDLADIIDNPLQSLASFQAAKAEDFADERSLALFFEAAHDALEELGGDNLMNNYFNLVGAFLEKYNLRYDLRRPCVLCPTLPGVFSSLIRDLKSLTSEDPHLDQTMKEYEDAVRDLRLGCTDGRIKTCIGKQFMLLEAIGGFDPSVTKNTLGDMCEQLTSWPHATVKEALKKLYGFASDYPGIRHGGHPKGASRAIEMRDMVAMSILLTGFMPYLESRLSAEAIYGGGGPVKPAGLVHAEPAPVTQPAPDRKQRWWFIDWLLNRRPTGSIS